MYIERQHVQDCNTPSIKVPDNCARSPLLQLKFPSEPSFHTQQCRHTRNLHDSFCFQTKIYRENDPPLADIVCCLTFCGCSALLSSPLRIQYSSPSLAPKRGLPTHKFKILPVCRQFCRATLETSIQ